MAMPIEFMKSSLLGTGSSNPSYLAVSVVGTLVILLPGLLVFQNIERTFVDTV
jgi:lipopolysaccharide transport system permease protein